MEHAPDLLLISEFNPALGEVAAFEELIGSHGGLGGRSGAVHPPPGRWALDEESHWAHPPFTATCGDGSSGLGIKLGAPG